MTFKIFGNSQNKNAVHSFGTGSKSLIQVATVFFSTSGRYKHPCNTEDRILAERYKLLVHTVAS